MDNKNAGPKKPSTADRAGLSSANLPSVDRTTLREEALAAEKETVIFEGKGVVNTQTVPEVLSATPGGASVPVTLIYGKNGSITFQAGDLGVAEGPETILDQSGNTAAPSSAISFHGDILRDGDSSGVNAGESVEFTGTYRLVAA